MSQNAYLIAGYSTLAVGLCAWRGQDLNWDLLNYHFYNPYLLLNDRFESDVHAAGVQSFLNPLVDIPLYAAVRLEVSPRLFYLSLAAFHGLTAFFVHRIAAALFSQRPTPLAMTAGVIAGCTAAFGAGFQTEVGTTMHDSTLAVLLLASLWLLVVRFDPLSDRSRQVLLLSGVLAGSATGMKLTVVPFTLGLLTTVLMLPGSARARVTRASWFCAAAGIGLVVSGGYWMWLMYSHFESPVFPFFNAVFQSPFAPHENFLDRRFVPKTALQAIFYPFYWTSTQSLVTEIPFRDVRIAMVLVSLWMLGLHRLLSLISRETREVEPLTGRLFLIAVFWGVSYVIWLGMFSVYRYAIPLEALSAVLVIGVSAALTHSWTKCLALALPVCLVACGSVRPPDYYRIPWSESYFGVDTTRLETYTGATVLMWDFPQAYVVPLFPPSSRFVRLLSNWGLEENTAMWDRVVQAVATADERLYLLDHPQFESSGDMQASRLADLGLQRSDATCATYSSYPGGFRLCALRRIMARAATVQGPG
jgi:hypothetical protein